MGRVTSRDVAREAGVSQNTVSLVARDSARVRPETKRAVRAVMERLGYHPNAVAAALRSQQTRTLAFVVHTHAVHHPVAAALLAGTIAAAERHGYTVVAQTVRDDDPAATLALYRSQSVSGAMVFARITDDPMVGGLHHGGCPVVSLLQPCACLPPDHSIVADDGGGAAAAIDHLCQRGHHRLGLVAAPSDDSTLAQARIGAARAAAAAADAPLRVVMAADWTVEAGREAGLALLAGEDPPTGVFAISDRLAVGVLEAATATGLAVPRDVAVVGFDNIEWARYCHPPLTTVEFPLEDIAAEGVARLLRPHAPPAFARAPARLVVRQST